MKTKKLGLISAIVLAMVFLFALNASAAWYPALITKVGVGGSSTIIKLTHDDPSPQFTDQLFIADPQAAKEMLATALTAIANGMGVTVNLSGITPNSIIYNMYLKP
jgi:hypothetical protein